MPLPQTIAGRLTFWFLLIALLPSLVLVGTMYWVLRGEVRKAVESHLELVLGSRQAALEAHANNWRREIRLVADSPRLVELTERLATVRKASGPAMPDVSKEREDLKLLLGTFGQTLEGESNLIVLDANGTRLAALNEQGLVTFERGPKIGDGTKVEAAIKQAIDGTRAIVTPLEPIVAGSRTREIVNFAVAPLFRDQTVVGVLVAEIDRREDIRRFFEEVKATRAQVEGLIKIDDQLHVITREKDQQVDLGQSRVVLAAPESTGFETWRDRDGTEWVGAWGPVDAYGMIVLAKTEASNAYSTVSSQLQTGIILLAVLFFVVLGLAWLVSRSMSRPIVELALTAERVASGDLTVDITDRGGGEVGQLVASIKDMTEHLRGLIGNIQHSIVTLMSTATEIAATARQQQQTVNEYGSSTVQVATAVNEISATSQGLLKTMSEVNASASRAADLAATGQSGLAGMHTTMTRLAESTGSISSRLSVISERANNINLVVTTITKVADQTNLLSINAAIEAEKAGEYGRGFLVVAREIRRLADMTAMSTLDIERIVKEMQHSVTAGVMEMDKFNEQVRQGVNEVERISEQLSEIIRSVQVLIPRFEQVTEGMSAQSQGAEQIREAMAHLSEGASQTAESLREFNKATDQLREAVGGLKEDISKFST